MSNIAIVILRVRKSDMLLLLLTATFGLNFYFYNKTEVKAAFYIFLF